MIDTTTQKFLWQKANMKGSKVSSLLFLSIFSLMMLIAAPLSAALPKRPLPAGVTISAEVDLERIVVEDLFRYSIIVSGPIAAEKVKNPSFSGIDGISFVSGPTMQRESSMVQDSNGKMSWEQKVSQVFTLKATKTGEVTIPPARVTINGSDYLTNEVNLQIIDVPNMSDAFEGIISARTNSAQNNKVLEGRYFAYAEIPDEVYRGQAVPVDIYVYRDPSLQAFTRWQVVQNISGNDFIVPDAAKNQNLRNQMSWESVMVKGKKFLRSRVMTAYVVPTRSGELRLVPPVLRIDIPAEPPRRNDLGSMFQWRTMSTVAADLQMRAQEVSVKSPPEKMPGTLEQIVGNPVFMEVTVDRNELPQRELISLKVSFTGQGFFDFISQPELPDFASLSRVDQSVDSRSEISRGNLLSQKDFEYVYQAISPGEIEIPELKFSLFDPRSGKQEVISSEAISVKITPDNASTQQIAGASGSGSGRSLLPASGDRADAKELGQDVAYIVTSPLTAGVASTGSAFYTRPWFWGLQLLPFLASILYGFVLLAKKNSDSNSPKRRMREAVKESRKAHGEALANKGSGNKDVVLVSLTSSVLVIVSAVTGKSEKGMTVDSAAEELRENGISSGTIELFKEFMQQLDNARYAPGDLSDNKIDELVNKSLDLSEALQTESKL